MIRCKYQWLSGILRLLRNQIEIRSENFEPLK